MTNAPVSRCQPTDCTPVADAARCPLCGQPNGCGMELARACGQPDGQTAEPCWCTRASFPPSLLALVPRSQQRLACICAACASRHAAGATSPSPEVATATPSPHRAPPRATEGTD